MRIFLSGGFISACVAAFVPTTLPVSAGIVWRRKCGDALEPQRHRKGFDNIVQMRKPGGRLNISITFVKQTEVHFNAQRLLHPSEVLTWNAYGNSPALERFDYVDDRGALNYEVNLLDQVNDAVFGCHV